MVLCFNGQSALLHPEHELLPLFVHPLLALFFRMKITAKTAKTIMMMSMMSVGAFI